MTRPVKARVRVPTTMRSGSLCDALDELLDTGVVAMGEIKVQVADVDLLYIALELVASSFETARGKDLPGANGGDART